MAYPHFVELDTHIDYSVSRQCAGN